MVPPGPPRAPGGEPGDGQQPAEQPERGAEQHRVAESKAAAGIPAGEAACPRDQRGRQVSAERCDAERECGADCGKPGRQPERLPQHQRGPRLAAHPARPAQRLWRRTQQEHGKRREHEDGDGHRAYPRRSASSSASCSAAASSGRDLTREPDQGRGAVGSVAQRLVHQLGDVVLAAGSGLVGVRPAVAAALDPTLRLQPREDREDGGLGQFPVGQRLGDLARRCVATPPTRARPSRHVRAHPAEPRGITFRLSGHARSAAPRSRVYGT